MAASPDDEVQRWKDKYLERAEAFDREEEKYKSYIGVMQRLVSRTSMAAEGADKQLDKQLKALRELLRQDQPQARELEKRLEQIDEFVLGLEDGQAEYVSNLQSQLGGLLDLLSSLEPGSEYKRKIKRFKKILKKRPENLRDVPKLVAEFSELQTAVFQNLGQDGGGDNSKPGFLQRIFGSKQSVEDDTHKIQASTSDPASAETTAELSPEKSYSVEQTELGHDEADDSIDKAPRFSAVSKHISSVLQNLLKQISIPDSFRPVTDKVMDNIRAGLNWYELGPTLDDVSNIVISAIGKGQKDFEQFLKGLDNRLKTLQDFLLESQRSHEAHNQASHRLDEFVRGQVANITSSVQGAENVDELKQSVSVSLDHIVTALSDYVTEEDARDKALADQVVEMEQRLAEMEAETEHVKEELAVERKRSQTDVLTQLPNREAFDERYDLEFDRWHRYGSTTSLVVADIDHFKAVNDNYGHLAGDKVIQIIAAEIAKRIRRTDFVARYGGEEFAVILPETDGEVAELVMNKTREMISRCPFHFRDERVQVTMSFGVVELAGEMTKESAFELADKALYTAKEGGRNKVVLQPHSTS